MSRRRLFGLAGVGALGVGAGMAGGLGVARATGDDADGREPNLQPAAYPFYGAQQAGIVTPAQDRLHFASFNLSAEATRGDLILLLQRWSDAAAKMTQGQDAGDFGAVSGPYDAPPRRHGRSAWPGFLAPLADHRLRPRGLP